MAPVGAAAADPRGGDAITTVRRHRPRVLTALGSAGLGVALAAYPLALAGSYLPAPAALGLAALATLAAALAAARTGPLPWALAALVGEYAIARGTGGSVDAAVPLYAAALFACAELGYWSCDLRRVRVVDATAVSARLAAIAVTTALGALAASVVVAAAGIAGPGTGIGPLALGTACAVGAVAVLAWLGALAARQRPSDAAAGSPPSSVPNTRR
ncbi:MAG TPA: hypothetical protein VGL44_03945 [Gaiellales bacterium]